MTPFLGFRLWIRRAPTGERVLVVGAVALVLTLIAWACVPVAGQPGPAKASGVVGGAKGPMSQSQAGSSSTTSTPPTKIVGTTTTVANPGPGAPSPTGGATAGIVSGAGTTVNVRAGAGTTTTTTTAAGQGNVQSNPTCGASGSTDQGITSSDIGIDVDVADLAGQAGNSLVGLPSPQQEEAYFATAIASANALGGARCRQIVAKYYTANPLDQSSLQALCLNIVADHPFALLDDGLASPVGSVTPRDCPPENKVPEFGSLPLSQAEATKFAPYLFSYNETSENIVNDWIFGANQLNWFTGAKKVGLLEQDCIPDLNTLVLSDLAKIGFPTSDVATFDFGCPNTIPSPADVEEAVLQFKSDGVTNVLDDGGVYESYFSNDAQTEGYMPKYSVGDQGTIALWDNRDFGPNASNFSGGLAITPTEYGAENTTGSTYSAATQYCDQIMAAKGLASAQTSPDAFAGVACDLVTMFVQAADAAPQLVRADLAAGLASLGQVALSYPSGPANFARSQGQYGGGYWRADTWTTACACFQVSESTFNPSFSMSSSS
jgi:hypothetical protein